MSANSNEDAKKQIKLWLEENGHEVTSVKDKGANFHFSVDFPKNSSQIHHILQPKTAPSCCTLINNVAIPEAFKNELEVLSVDERGLFYRQLTKELMAFDNTYNLDLNKEGVCQGISFTYEFYFDSLTKTQLYKALLLNHKTVLYAFGEFNEKFGALTKG